MSDHRCTAMSQEDITITDEKDWFRKNESVFFLNLNVGNEHSQSSMIFYCPFCGEKLESKPLERGGQTMKTPMQLIQYYTRKAAQYSSAHPSKHRNPYRYNRLMNYKKMMHSKLISNSKKPSELVEG